MKVDSESYHVFHSVIVHEYNSTTVPVFIFSFSEESKNSGESKS